MRYVLAIAGSDPTGGAGLQRDVETILEHGARPLGVVTSVTVQDGLRVTASRSLPAWLVKEELEILLERFSPDAVKIGLTGSPGVTDTIHHILAQKHPRGIVVDPVIRATSGYRFARTSTLCSLKRLMGIATIVTPNIEEAELLTGVSIRNTADMERAGERLLGLGCGCVLVKGGHLKEDPVDLLLDGKRVYRFPARRIRLSSMFLHGTGCILSTAIACGLAEGLTVRDSVERARAYLQRVLRRRMSRGTL